MTDQHWQQLREPASRQQQLAQAAATLHLDWENLEVLSQQVHLPATARLLAEVVAARLDPTASEMALDLLAQLGRDQAYLPPAFTARSIQTDYEEIIDQDNSFLFFPVYSQLEQPDPRWADQAAIEQVCQVWGEYNYPLALTQLIENKGWIAHASTTPAESRLLTALLAGQTSRIATELTGSALALQLLVELAESYWEQNTPPAQRKGRAAPSGSTVSVENLLENVPQLAETAYLYVEEQLPPAALAALALLWSKQRQPYLLKVLRRYQYLPSHPPYVGVLLALASDEQEFLSYAGSWVVAPLVWCLSDSDPIIARRAARVLSALKHKEAIDALCQLICEEDAPAQVLSIAKEAGYLPTALPARALYLFMTGQWEAYEGLDFPNFGILTTLYATATPRLRRRIAAQVRRSGNSQYVRIVVDATASGSRQTEITPTTVAESKTGAENPKITPSASRPASTSPISSTSSNVRRVNPRQLELELDLLSLNQEWGTLWQRVLEWPVAYAVKALLKLSEAGWRPPVSPAPSGIITANGEVDRRFAPEDNTLFHQLKELAQNLNTARARANGFSQLGADQWLPPAYPQLTLELTSLLGRSKLSGLVFADLPGTEQVRSGLVLAAGRKLIIYDHLQRQLVKVVAKASPARIEQLLYLPSPALPTGAESGWLIWTDKAGVLWGSTLAELVAATASFKPQKLGQHSQPVKALFTPLEQAAGRAAETGRADYLPTQPPARGQWFSLQTDGRLTVWQWVTQPGQAEVIRREIELSGNWEGANEVVWAVSPTPNEPYLVIASPEQRLTVVDLQNLAVVANLAVPSQRANNTLNLFSIHSSNSKSTVSALAFTPDGHTLLAAITAPKVEGSRQGTTGNNPQLELFELDWSGWLAAITNPAPAPTGPTFLASQQTFFRPLVLPALTSESEAVAAGDLHSSVKPVRSSNQRGCWLQLFKEPAGNTLAILADQPSGYISFIELKSGLELGRVQSSFSRMVWGGSKGRYLATLETTLAENSNLGENRKASSAATSHGTEVPAEQKAVSVIRVWDSRIVHLKELLFERGPEVGDIDGLAGLDLLLQSSKKEQAFADQFVALPDGLQAALSWLQLILPYKFRYLVELEAAYAGEPAEFDIELA